MLNKHLSIAPEIETALQQQKPIVALESTIISHGMPYPQNVETARIVEQTVRDNGAIPATIGIIDGKLIAGLNQDQIKFIGKNSAIVTKTSRRDLPFIIARKGHGTTTVAATMIIAQMAGIKIFATGGIGGVHRGAETSMDISADLQELAKTNVSVVCAGAKAILDLKLTLEYLETHGVPVIGYQSKNFPAFYSRESGIELEYFAETPEQIAEILRAKRDLNLQGACLVTNPIPEAYEMEFSEVNKAIEIAVRECEEKKITGKKISPYLLNRIKQLTAGKSLEANIKLVLNNAKLAAQIAKSEVSGS